MKDHNYDDAVSDLRAALENSGGSEAIEEKLEEAKNAQAKWRCVDPDDEKVWHENDCHWHDEGRDHRAVLELPSNLDDIPHEKQCEWLKKQCAAPVVISSLPTGCWW